jgi:hypothetical protein
MVEGVMASIERNEEWPRFRAACGFAGGRSRQCDGFATDTTTNRLGKAKPIRAAIPRELGGVVLLM